MGAKVLALDPPTPQQRHPHLVRPPRHHPRPTPVPGLRNPRLHARHRATELQLHLHRHFTQQRRR
ncbi:hypothetical protein BTJ68_13386 [Hortaea werneckii EXF-2000]|uniref:Uncharacterized protein n=1 Tax=Hortaea werneckii EXF-2000 TaxID=1157616 RepID=A0A1Z5SRR5_HORWE|nr:hypothetical protein BTJ68_13386 [Hortaea werneckii EXF-2000]